MFKPGQQTIAFYYDDDMALPVIVLRGPLTYEDLDGSTYKYYDVEIITSGRVMMIAPGDLLPYPQK